MIRHLCLIVPCIIATGLLAADLPEKWSKRLESTEANYQAAVQKADNVRFYAIQKASQERVKALKSALTDATKAGDFDAATELKSRLAAAESSGGVRAKPKNTVKFGGHEYALIEDKSTWHVAKRQCEEMGGHLATIENAAESETLLTICRTAKVSAWIGGTDEDKEGEWKWVTGTPIKMEFKQDNHGDSEHFLGFYHDLNGWVDLGNGRFAFLCEWDN